MESDAKRERQEERAREAEKDMAVIARAGSGTAKSQAFIQLSK